MFVLGVFGPVLFVALPMLAGTVAMIMYIVAHYCIFVPLSRQSQQGESSSGMKMIMKKVSSEEDAEQLDNRAGN